MHFDMDLNDVVGFDPTSSLSGSPWPNQWLDKIKQKMLHRMDKENENQLQFVLKHLLDEAREVKSFFLRKMKNNFSVKNFFRNAWMPKQHFWLFQRKT